MTSPRNRHSVKFLAAFTVMAAALTAVPSHAVGLYGTTQGADPALYSINPLTGATSMIGASLPFQASALTFDDGSLIAGTLDGSFYTIDTTTGQSSLIGTIGNDAQLFGLASLNGSLYGLQDDPANLGIEGLYQFDLSGGSVAENLLGDVLDSNGNPINGAGLTALDGSLVTADAGLGAGGYLYSLSVANGLATALDTTGNLSTGLPLNSLDSLASQNGVLYGYNNDSYTPDYSLYQIDPGTAAVSNGVTVGLPIGAIAFATPSVPEPSALWLLIPALGLLVVSRRRSTRKTVAGVAALAGLASLMLTPHTAQAQAGNFAYPPTTAPVSLPQPPNNPRASATENPLTTGKALTLPPLGTQTNVGSLPLNMVISPDGQYAISSDMGFREFLIASRTKDGTTASSLNFNGANPMPDALTSKEEGLYYGLAFNPTKNSDGTYTLYAAQGNENTIAVLTLDGSGKLTDTGTRFHGSTPSAPGIKSLGGLTLNQIVSVPPLDTPAGMAMDTRGFLYVSNDDTALPTVPASVSVYNTNVSPITEVGRYTFPVTDNGTNYPYSLAVLPDGSQIFVGSLRDGAVYVLSANNPKTGASADNPLLVGKIMTGSHPEGLTLNANHSCLYVANAQSDTVSVVATATDAVTSTVLLRPQGALSLPGVTPDNLALSPDGNTLYATLGDMNAVAVIAVARPRLLGYIPVGWYPTAAVVSPDSQRLLIANAKGNYTRYPNPTYGTALANSNGISTYNENMIEGDIQTLTVPTPVILAHDTQMTLANNRITPLTDNPASSPLASIGLQSGKIRHILYIVKENRTYDQILGDLKSGPEDADGNGTGAQLGNGDPALAFGEQITPNLHSLARRFVLLDNYYEGGEVSEDGWNWSTQGMANEFTIHNVPYNYSDRNYYTQTDFQGQNNGYPVGGFTGTDVNGKLNSILFPAGGPPITDIAQTPGGYIWDDAVKAKLSYRNYGVDLSTGAAIPGVGNLIPDNYPTHTNQHPEGHDLAGNSDYDFRHFDTNFPDSEAGYFDDYGQYPTLMPGATGPAYASPPNAGTDSNALFAETQYGKYNAPSRYSEFAREFGEMLSKGTPAHPDAGVPAFMTMTLMTDHTQGSTVGKNIHTPESMVADDDYGVGQMVDLISHSPVWDSTAIFVIEDDSQDGPDHVDCHRSICYVISPYIKQSVVDSHFYNTDSVLKTMELLLGLPAMNQYDAIADPILDWNTTPNNSAAYNAILPPQSVIDQLNMTPSQMASLDHKSTQYRLAALSNKMDFKHPDAAPDQLLNEIIWKSIKGWNAPVPAPVHGLAVSGPTGAKTQTVDDDDAH
jgi:YVTN family beta-propeller protein